MSWGEAMRHARTLTTDPSSALAASTAGWDFSVDRTSLVLMNLYDLQHQIAWAQGGRKGGKPKPYPRPWQVGGKTTTKPAAEVTHEQILAALRFAGHTAELPSS